MMFKWLGARGLEVWDRRRQVGLCNLARILCVVHFIRLALQLGPPLQDRFKIMGWDTDQTKFASLPDSKLCSLVGEGLHLGCLGLVLYSAYLSEGPWWSRPGGSSVVPAPGFKEEPADTSGALVDNNLSKRRRRTGCVPLPRSAVE